MYRKIFILVFLFFMTSGLSIAVSSAEGKYQIKQMTPEVSQALENRKARFEKLHTLKAQGAIGENNKGYVQVLDPTAEAQSTADAENNDRKIIYATIADQNGLQDAINTIEKVFASVQRDKAVAGEKIQTEDGSWTTKQ